MQDASLVETYWRSLRYFNIYRLTIAVLLIVFLAEPSATLGLFDPIDRRLFLRAGTASVLLSMLSLAVLSYSRRHFNLQLSFQVTTDIVIYVVMIHATGGLRGGLGIMLLVSLAAAGLVGQGRLVLFYAAAASLAVLLQQIYQALQMAEFDAAPIFQAGLLSAGFFATASTARLLARRVVANEELARRRGRDLQRQIRVSERAIAQVQDGVLVVGSVGEILQANPRAQDYLGVAGSAEGTAERLAIAVPGLAQGLAIWQRGETGNEWEFRSPVGGRQLHARFVPVGGESTDTLIFLEDIGQQRELAQQLKLAALGRLTANIAHEIRNPLSAIQHSAELLGEVRRDAADERLLRILIDNTHRLQRIVSDVLQVGRRDRVNREPIDLKLFLPMFIDEFCTRSAVPADVVHLRFDGAAVLDFDRAHLHQVLSNLCDNALRYCRRQAGSLRFWTEGERGAVRLNVADDGGGIPPNLRSQVFEPFFTTHAKGTGLGLYIARELCEANGARLELMENAPGAHFRLMGG